MTTIARVHNLLVADRKGSNYRVATLAKKIKKTENALWVVAGDAALADVGVDAILRDGKSAKVNGRGSILRFRSDGTSAHYICTGGRIIAKEQGKQAVFAIGSGSHIVEPALLLGFNIPDAFDLVFAMDGGSGGGIDVYDLRTLEPVDVETLRC